MEQKKEIKRGEMWYISTPNSNPASAALGRPAIVLSNEKACASAPEIAVVYCTTNVAKEAYRENVPLSTPERAGTARCNGVPLIPRQWFQYKMCNISEEELRAIEKGLFYALDISVDEEMRSLKRQLSFYKALYRETLNELARKQLAEDLEMLTFEKRYPREVYITAEDLVDCTPVVPTEPVAEAKPTEEDELAELERQLAELEAVEPTEPDPADPTDPTDPTEKPPKKMVNVNNATWWDLHRKFGIDQDTAKEIVGERMKAKGRFQSVEEVLNLRCLSKKDAKKMAGRIEL